MGAPSAPGAPNWLRIAFRRYSLPHFALSKCHFALSKSIAL